MNSILQKKTLTQKPRQNYKRKPNERITCSGILKSSLEVLKGCKKIVFICMYITNIVEKWGTIFVYHFSLYTDIPENSRGFLVGNIAQQLPGRGAACNCT